MQLSIVVKNFSPKIAPNRALRAFDGLCDDEAVPLICPTRQVFAQSASLPVTPATLHGVVFDILVGSHSCVAARNPA
jgi:hypothetical protein